MSHPLSGVRGGAGMRGSMGRKKAIRLTPGRWIARTQEQRVSGRQQTRKEQYRTAAPSRPKRARWRQLSSALVRIQGGLEVRSWLTDRAGLDRVRSAR